MTHEEEEPERVYELGDDIPNYFIDTPLKVKVPKCEPVHTLPHEKEILRTYFAIRPSVNTNSQAVTLTSNEVGISTEAIRKIVRRANAQEEAKRQRKDYADAIYEGKIPTAKAVVALSLDKLFSFIEKNKPETFEDAKALSKIATDINTLLRLELGQSTENLSVVQKTEKSVTVLLKELQTNDPFVDYPKLPHGEDSKSGS